MKKNVTDILDIHTHKQEVDTQGKSIINYPLLADSPLYMPLAENVEVAVGRGSYYSIGIHPWGRDSFFTPSSSSIAFTQWIIKGKPSFSDNFTCSLNTAN